MYREVAVTLILDAYWCNKAEHVLHKTEGKYNFPFYCQGFEARGTTISGRLNAYDHLLKETITDPSQLHLSDLEQTQHFEVRNATLLHNSDDETDEAANDDILELDMPLHMESYFCDIPSQLQYHMWLVLQQYFSHFNFIAFFLLTVICLHKFNLFHLILIRNGLKISIVSFL